MIFDIMFVTDFPIVYVQDFVLSTKYAQCKEVQPKSWLTRSDRLNQNFTRKNKGGQKV